MNQDPRPFTLRQLLWMTEGRDRFAWSLASSMMALIANCHKGSKGRALKASDFNPTLTKADRNRDAILITDENAELMRDEFKWAMNEKVTLTPIKDEHEED